MDKQQLVKELLSKGVMVTPQMLEKIVEEDTSRILKDASGSTCTVVHEQEPQSKSVKFRIRETEQPRDISPNDVIRANIRRYEALRKMLLRRISAVSISNSRGTSSRITLLGMVRERRGDTFVLEDATGTIDVKARIAVNDDDVIAVSGWIRNGTLFAEDVIYPDIPISREVNTMEGKVLLTFNQKEDKEGADIVLTPDALNGEGRERRMTNPAWVLLEDGNGRSTVFVYRAKGTVDRKVALSWLRKRVVLNGNFYATGSDNVLDPVPDIMWIISDNEPWSENYKGVTLVSFGKGHSALLDLKTRKIETR
jgi:hypothetical protein